MAKPTKPKTPAPLKSYIVRVEYTVSGTVAVEARSEESARACVPYALDCPGTCEIIDWDVKSIREERSF